MSGSVIKARVVWALVWLAGGLPMRWQRGLGGALGRLVGLLGLREARVARRNLELCFPQMELAQRQALWRQNLVETGRTLTETLRLWTRPSTRHLGLVREVVGGELLDAALASGNGTLIAAPHLGNWELLNQWLASRSPLAIVYRPPRADWADALIRRARGQPGVTQVRAEASGVRTLFRILKEGGMVGILPDQQPKRGDGEFAPFFGIPALTMTLLPRLAQRTGATVLMAFAERLPDADGFRIRILPASAALSDADPAIATAALNAAVESCIALVPAQYQWSYKRFTIRPENAEPIRYD
ncbi:MAG: lipid A biosynthesis lauroyl acyltransferase [Lysobacteraceae bacterium]